jgi:flagellar assembly protein FliH
VVVPVVERSLQMLSDREQLTIRVNPDDLKVVLDAKPQLLEAVDGIQKLTVLEDPSVRPGGCLVQTPTTEIDARLETQLQELARSIRSL